MAKPASEADLRALLEVHSGPSTADGYWRHPQGGLAWQGDRPGPGWHFHGYFSRSLVVLAALDVVEITLWKGRWKKAGTNHTVSARAPDEEGACRFSSVVVALQLYAWLCSQVGVLHHSEIVPSLEEGGASRRTVQRWLSRARRRALAVQQRLRRAILERSEPRSIEQLFRGGLSPPASWHRRHRRAPTQAETLWRGLAMLFSAAVQLGTHPRALLTEARRRPPEPDRPVLLS